MRNYDRTQIAKSLNWLAVALLLVMVFLLNAPVFGAEPSLIVSVYLDKKPAVYDFDISESVDATIVMQNSSNWPVNAERGFSDIELHRFLTVTDPVGEKHRPVQKELPTNMQATFIVNGQEAAPAEILPKNWVRSVKISDLASQIPVMKVLPGWYTIEAELPYVFYKYASEAAGLGLVGFVGQGNTWNGTIKSSKIKFYLQPAKAAQFKIQILDLHVAANTPYPGQVPVNVFKIDPNAILEDLNLEEIWDNQAAVLSGRSKYSGWVKWDKGYICVPRIDGTDYLVIGKYLNEFKGAIIEADSPEWIAADSCENTIPREILFRVPEERYALCADNSIYMRNKVELRERSNIGAPIPESEDGPWLNSAANVVLGENVITAPYVKIIGDSVKISSTATVWDIYYETAIDNRTSAFNSENQGFEDLPDELKNCDAFGWISLIDREFTVKPLEKKPKPIIALKGTVYQSENQGLPPGDYVEFILESGSTLKLAGGTYDIENLTMGSGSSLICEGPIMLNILERLYPGTKSYIGPSDGEDATKVTIYVAGKNGKKARITDKPLAAEIGQGNTILARMYVPNGTLKTGEGCTLKGAFVAQDIEIGSGTVIHEQSAY